MVDFDKSFTIFLDNFDLFWYGTKITIILALVGTIAGLIIGLLFGAIRATTIDIKDKKIIVLIKKALKIISEIYIWFFIQCWFKLCFFFIFCDLFFNGMHLLPEL